MTMKTRLLAAAALFAAWFNATAQPTFLAEPADTSASPGANILLLVAAYAPEPIFYEWYKNGAVIAGETDDILFLSSVTAADAGEYFAVATVSSGSATSAVVNITIDGLFTKVVDSALVLEPGSVLGAVWGDYDNDGYPDVFMAKGGTDFNRLFRNNGDGTFARVTTGPVATDYGNSSAGSFADYDNDGWLDLVVLNNGTNFLYRNNGDGTFARTNGGALAGEAVNASSGAWADYDRDGYLDFLASVRTANAASLFYRNNRNGTFTRILTGPGAIPSFQNDFLKSSYGQAWGDYNNDGWADLVVFNFPANFGGFFNVPGHEFLYLNDTLGDFTKITGSPVVSSGGASFSGAWVDYDNDGDLDLFVTNLGLQNSALYRNNGNGTFTQITSGPLVNDGSEDGDSTSCTWGDYDNDGWQDVFVANYSGLNNYLYHNNGDGTFTAIETGSPTHDGGNSYACSFVDYDRDGALDLFVSNVSGENFLYHNSGNSNGWLRVLLRGDISNRSGVGAKVRVRATIHGVTRWQMREIAARDGLGSPSTLDAHFGLGDAASVELIRVEWPSGLVTELPNIASHQTVTVFEPAAIAFGPAPSRSEGDLGVRALQFIVRLTQPATNEVTVDYFTSDLTATNGVDYLATNGTLTFAIGQMTNFVTVLMLGDVLDEINKTLQLNLTNNAGAPMFNPQVVGTINDDDPLELTIANASVVEGNSGSLTTLVFFITLNKPVNYACSVDYVTSDSSARTPDDYFATSGLLIFQPGETSRTVNVTVVGDSFRENATEIFFLNLSNPTNVVIFRNRGTGAIVEDDPLPVLSVSPLTFVENNNGTNQYIINVRLTGVTTITTTVGYNLSNNLGTASRNIDYVGRNGSLSFPAGVTNQTISLGVIGDALIEPNETIVMLLSNAVNAVAVSTNIVHTILDDDLRMGVISVSGGNVNLSFLTASNQFYRIERSPSIAPPVWVTVPGLNAIAGTGGAVQVMDPIPPDAVQRFYRSVLISP